VTCIQKWTSVIFIKNSHSVQCKTETMNFKIWTK